MPKLRCRAKGKGSWEVHRKQDLVTIQSVPGTPGPSSSRALFLAEPDPECGSVLWVLQNPVPGPICTSGQLCQQTTFRPSDPRPPPPFLSHRPHSFWPDLSPIDGSLSSCALGTPRSTWRSSLLGAPCTKKSSVF